jgi:glycosyltransferase involved in cell wall biosynthesis
MVQALQSQGCEVKVSSIFTESMYLRRNISRAHKVVVSLQLVCRLFIRILQIISVRKSDIVVLHREIFPFFLPYFEDLCIRKAKASILDFDDALYSQPSGGRDWRAPFRNPENFKKIVAKVDKVFVASPVLLAWASQFNSNVLLRHTLPESRRKINIEQTPKKIVWIGSDSSFVHLHSKIELLQKVAVNLDLYICILGGNRMLGYQWPDRFHVELWTKEREDLVLCEPFLGIMPLIDDEWSQGKGAFKIYQYMSVGMPVIATPLGMNLELISDSECGILAMNDIEWEQGIYRLFKDLELFTSLGSNGFEWISAKIASSDSASDVIC